MTEETPKTQAPTTDEAVEVDVELGVKATPSMEKLSVAALQKDRTLYDEIMDALHGAFLMFCIPDLIAMAREGVLQGDKDMIQKIVDKPCTLYDVFTIYSKNKDLLTAERLGCEDRADMYHAALSLDRFADIATPEMRDKVLRQVTIHVLSDMNEEEECVYVIACNTISKKVTVAFRGSVTSKDFKQDAKALMTRMENPVKAKDGENLPDNVGVHLGFYEYLYGTPKENKEGKPPEQKVILDKVIELLQANPGFKLYIVGHSLGGALTTLLTPQAAGDDRIPSPITAITSGAPKVGNLAFLQTFEYLERSGRVRCIQVANNKDPVTKSPPFGNFDPCSPIFCRQIRFRHVGLRLLLNPKGFMIWYPMQARSYPGILIFDWIMVGTNCAILCCGCFMFLLCWQIAIIIALPLCCCWAYKGAKSGRQHHTQLKYINRIEFGKDELMKLKLNELNEERFGRPVYTRTRVIAKHTSTEMFDATSIFFGKKSIKDDDDKAADAAADEKAGKDSAGDKDKAADAADDENVAAANENAGKDSAGDKHPNTVGL